MSEIQHFLYFFDMHFFLLLPSSFFWGGGELSVFNVGSLTYLKFLVFISSSKLNDKARRQCLKTRIVVQRVE